MMGWLIACILLVALVVKWRRPFKKQHALKLALLRRIIARMAAAGEIGDAQKQTLMAAVDDLISDLGTADMPPPLPVAAVQAPSAPQAKPVRPSAPPKPVVRQTASAIAAPAADVPPPLPVKPATPSAPAPAKPAAGRTLILSAKTITRKAVRKFQKPDFKPKKVKTVSEKKTKDEGARHAWQPRKPGRMEQAVAAAAGWSRLAAPFMVQNIGWFISAFLFIAGSVFLVIYTEDFLRAFIVSVILFGYTLLMLWGACKLLSKRRDIQIAGRVLAFLSMLLIPLSMAAAVRLIDIQAGFGLRDGAGLLVTAANMFILFWAAKLASGLMDRALRDLHPKLFMLISALQLGIIPLALVNSRPGSWPVLAACHGAVIGLLGFGMVRFNRDWMKRIFADQDRLAWYSVGTLAYAAGVSFIHLTLASGASLPAGYYGLVLMVLSALLFYVDAGFKTYIRKFPYLSRFTFGIYSLSVIALIAAAGSGPAQWITLVLGAGVYGMMVRNYLTLPPLYLLLGCLGWLYGLLILQHIPPDGHFLAGLPGMAGLFLFHRWAVQRNAASVSLLLFRALMAVVVGLGVWSLGHARPGWTAFITGAVLTALLYAALRHLPDRFLSALGMTKAAARLSVQQTDLTQTPWLYAVMLSVVSTLAWAPRIPGLSWSFQTAVGLGLTALILNLLGLTNHKKVITLSDVHCQTAVLLNSSLAALVSGVILALVDQAVPVHHVRLTPFLALAGGVLVWQGVTLRIRFLFSWALALGGAAGALFKINYFPGPSAGVMEMLLVFGAWALIFHTDRLQQAADLLSDGREENAALSPLTLFGIFRAGTLSVKETVRTPLVVAMAALWVWSAFRLITYVPLMGPTPVWILNAGLACVSSLLIAGYFNLHTMWPFPVLLGFGAFMGGVFRWVGPDPASLIPAAAAYALGVWFGVGKALARPEIKRLARALGLTGKNAASSIRTATLWMTFFITMASLSLCFVYWLLLLDADILPGLIVCMAFLWAAGRTHQKVFFSYIFLGAFTLAAIVLNAWAFALNTHAAVFIADSVGLLFVCLGAGMAGLSAFLKRHDLSSENPAGNDFGRLYQSSLAVTGMTLSAVAACRQMVLIYGGGAPGMMDAPILGLSGLGLLVAAHALGSSLVSLSGILTACAALFLAETRLFHAPAVILPWPVRIFGDQWIMMAVLGFGLAWLADFIAKRSDGQRIHAHALGRAAFIFHGWVYWELVVICVAGIDGAASPVHGPALFLFQGLALFPLLRDVPNARRLRGPAVMALFTGLIFSLLSIFGIPVIHRITLSVWAFALAGLAAYVLPAVNRRFPERSLSPTAWPWTGFALIGAVLAWTAAGNLSGSFPVFPGDLMASGECAYFAGAALYCHFMGRHVKMKGIFAWPASLCVATALTGLLRDVTALVGLTGANAPWLILALVSLALACFRRHGLSLLWTASFCFAWSLAGAVLSTGYPFNGSGDIYLPLIYSILAVGLFPLTASLHKGNEWRGAGPAALLSAAWFCLIPCFGGTWPAGPAAALWAFALWSGANFVLPILNQRRPKFAVAPSAWLWTGLITAVSGWPLAEGSLAALTRAPYWLSVSAFLYLFLRNASWIGLPYVAGGALTLAGLLDIHRLAGGIDVHHPLPFMISTLVWGNLLLLSVPLWRAWGRNIAARLGWKEHDPSAPFPVFAFFIFACWLAFFGVAEAAALMAGAVRAINSTPPVWAALVLAGSFLHLFAARPSRLFAHVLLLSVFGLMISVRIQTSLPLFQLPLLITLWCFALYFVRARLNAYTPESKTARALDAALSGWLAVSPWLAIPALLFIPVIYFSETLLTMGLWAVLTVLLRRKSKYPGLYAWAGRIMGLALLHTWPFILLPPANTRGLVLIHVWPLVKVHLPRIQMLLPWFALQLTLLVLFLPKIASWLSRRIFKNLHIQAVTSQNLRIESGLALTEWGMHLAGFAWAVLTGTSGQGAAAWAGGFAAVLTAGLLMALGLRRAKELNSGARIYGVAALAAGAALQVRFLILGAAFLTPWDTAALMAAAWGAFTIYRLWRDETLSAPLLRLAIILPLAAVLTAPMAASAHTCAALLTAGILYMTIRQATGNAAALYLGALTLNGAVYLWIPAWADRLSLFQLYVAPAALSALGLLHLHRKELKRSVLNGTRLAAVSILYGCATLDFFLSPELVPFIVVLMGSLIGVSAGVSLRIRAFLYGGLSFMVLNVLGQLFLFYSRQTLGKGVVLVALGTLILLGMIWFNVKRESVLKRIRIFRADLAQWA